MPLGFNDNTGQAERGTERFNEKEGQQLQSVTIVKTKRARTTPEKTDKDREEGSVQQRSSSPVCKEVTIDAISLLASAYAQDDEDESEHED